VEVRIRQTLDQHKVPMMGIILNGSAPGEGYGYGSYGGRSSSQYTYGSYGTYGAENLDGKKERRPRSMWARVKSLFGPEN